MKSKIYINIFIILSIFTSGGFSSPPNVLTCDKGKTPISWLWTIGYGILDVGTAGMMPDGPDYCVDYNRTSTIVQVQYHVDLTNTTSNSINLVKHNIFKDSNLTNACNNQDDRIHYCIPYCLNSTLQDIATKNALLYRSARDAATHIFKEMAEDESFAVTVLKVSFDPSDPAKLVQDIFFNPSYCSVYIGMQTIGFPYLYEIQIAKIYNSKSLNNV
uniref:Uncharacterized protein n=1 Tax=Parastrongyloides trichosuri TaxID=131310 RepID=A0A0N4Z168_PARTI